MDSLNPLGPLEDDSVSLLQKREEFEMKVEPSDIAMDRTNMLSPERNDHNQGMLLNC